MLLLVLSLLTTRIKLAKYRKKEQLLKELGTWWNTVLHPPALNDAAKYLDINDEDVDDEEVDDEEIDTITPKIMELGKSIYYKLAILIKKKKTYFSSTRNNAPSTKHSRAA